MIIVKCWRDGGCFDRKSVYVIGNNNIGKINFRDFNDFGEDKYLVKKEYNC